MSFLLRSCSNQKAKQAQQRISTQQKIKQDKKEESTEKADTKKEEEKEQEDNKLRDLDGNEIKMIMYHKKECNKNIREYRL